MTRRFGLAIIAAMASMIATASANILEPAPFAEIDGWTDDDHQAALDTFRRSCKEIVEKGKAFERTVTYGGAKEDWLGTCERANTAKNARHFFESEFEPFRVRDPVRPDGLFTGYFEPEALGSRTRDAEFAVPVYRRPPDLVALDEAAQKIAGVKYGRVTADGPSAYRTRKEIEQGALEGKGLEIVWLKDWADAFFIHVQGSGRVRLPDGSALRLGYAAKSGQPYTGIGGVLVERGVLTKDNMSMQSIRAWMKDNPQAARELMWENKSFVFFREVPIDDPNLGAPGAQDVPLTPFRSLAVDRGLWMFGTPMWIDTQAPVDREWMTPFRQLMIAQDTGTAIKGHVRGDVYWGWGDMAALTAGHMKSPGRMIVLLPKPLAARFRGTP